MRSNFAGNPEVPCLYLVLPDPQFAAALFPTSPQGPLLPIREADQYPFNWLGFSPSLQDGGPRTTLRSGEINSFPAAALKTSLIAPMISTRWY
jgi:hypothetical protein